MKTLSKVAFLTYNSVGDEVENGWHERNGRRALVLQGPSNQWHFRVAADALTGSSREVDAKLRVEIDNLWDTLVKSLPELDHVVIYVGIGGADRAIELAAQLPADKVTFLYCSCNRRGKIALMDAKVPGATKVETSWCGGTSDMLRMFTKFLDEGVLLNA